MSDTKNYNLFPDSLTLITIMLVLLKAFDKIDISWFWAFSPLIIGGGLVLCFLWFVMIIAIVGAFID